MTINGNSSGLWKVLLDPQVLVLLATGIGAFLSQWYIMNDQIRALRADSSAQLAVIQLMQKQDASIDDRLRSVETDDAVTKNRLQHLEN